MRTWTNEDRKKQSESMKARHALMKKVKERRKEIEELIRNKENAKG